MKTGINLLKIGFFMFLAGVPAWYVHQFLCYGLMIGCIVVAAIGSVIVLLKHAEEEDEANRKLFN